MNMLSPIKSETILCYNAEHFHVDTRQDIMTLNISEHEVVVESERGSWLYSVWIDGREAGAFISSAQLDTLIQGVATDFS